MILSETESMNRTCPLTLARSDQGSPCQGSGCMAWRHVKDALDESIGFCGMAVKVHVLHHIPPEVPT